ncbi:hypothetical protein AVEN_118800-1 [Araneus ventricosus]|uniref:Uncharacterized protein n=1 Tax=Araneus ventricosus TaxID=182803 RepID=A0A4Y2BWG5_ARAVE|nr:hypothetical protein AVEN_118800-1 [Araneus ventricosus]
MYFSTSLSEKYFHDNACVSWFKDSAQGNLRIRTYSASLSLRTLLSSLFWFWPFFGSRAWHSHTHLTSAKVVHVNALSFILKQILKMSSIPRFFHGVSETSEFLRRVSVAYKAITLYPTLLHLNEQNNS